MTRFTVMAEYYAFPVWDARGVSISPERRGLSISEDLLRDLREWNDEYTLNNLDDRWPSPDYYTQWRHRGLALARRFQKELGPDYEIWYGDWGEDDDDDEPGELSGRVTPDDPPSAG